MRSAAYTNQISFIKYWLDDSQYMMLSINRSSKVIL